MTRKIEILPATLTILGVGVLCMLGTWQLQRLDWKQDLIAQSALPAVTISDSAALNDDLHFRRVLVSGSYVPEAQLLVEPVIGTGHVYSAFELPDGVMIWVNRGVIATSDYHNAPLPVPAGTQNLTGLLSRTPEPSMFKPPNDPQAKIFYSVNTAEMSQAHDLADSAEFILYLEEIDEAALTPFQPELRNNHLQYAIFWFGMAVIMIVIYALRFHAPQRRPE
jgi:surfeit locus 1 family protein